MREWLIRLDRYAKEDLYSSASRHKHVQTGVDESSYVFLEDRIVTELMLLVANAWWSRELRIKYVKFVDSLAWVM